MEIGFHASHEQFPPSRLLRLATAAERAGFDAVLSSDHLTPWSERQAESGHAWAWLGAAMASTSLPYGVVTAPGYRYHPVVLAQAIATLEQIWPGRLTVALGSGQALNEHVTGEPWPDKDDRHRRLAECASVIRRLLAGETVDHDGLVTARQAQVYSRPAEPPPLFAAALTPATAGEVARWADGLITVNAPTDQLCAVLDAFAAGGGAGRPVHVQAHLSWAPTRAEVEAQALDQWRANALPPSLTEALVVPAQVDAATQDLPASALEDSVWMSNDLGWFAERLHEYDDLGIARVYLHQVGTDQERFVDAFGTEVLADMRRDPSATELP